MYELMKLFGGKYTSKTLLKMDEFGLLEKFFPSVVEMKKFLQIPITILICFIMLLKPSERLKNYMKIHPRLKKNILIKSILEDLHV